MACFHPNHIVVRDGQSRFLGSAAYLKSGDLFYDSPVSFHSLVPCGHCMGCRLDRARVWADRMLLELKDNNYKALFVTLTYNDAHLPVAWHVGYNYYDGFYEDVDPLVLYDDEEWIAASAGAPATLSIRDTQLFMKRLRRSFKDRRLRFFLAGEYGPRTHRPHYHAIIYGLTLSDFKDCRIKDFNKLGQPRYISKSFEKIWGNGYCVLAPVNWNTCAYVSRYTMKKVYKSEDPKAYASDQLPPFCTMSRRPGIGLLHADDLLQKGDKAFIRDVDLNGKECIREVYLGRAFIRSAAREYMKPVFEFARSIDAVQAAIDDAEANPGSVLESVLVSFRSNLESLRSGLEKAKELEIPPTVCLCSRQNDRAYNSVQRSISNLAVFGGYLLEYYQGKELHFLQRLKLLPERGDLFEQASSCKSGKG